MRIHLPKIRRRRPGPRPRLRRGFYIIPALFTVGNMFCGFYSIVQSNRGHLQWAAILILVAIIADILDGRIARLTNTTSSFGAAYDSLADVVSFGAAPAILAYQWGLVEAERIGICLAFLFLVAGSIRLARYNTDTHESADFKGLPIPAGAAAIALLVLESPKPVSHAFFIPVVGTFVFALSLLMVSNLPYRSFKDLNLRRPWPAPLLFLLALVVSLVLLNPHMLVLHLLSLILVWYILHAPYSVLRGRVRRRRITDLPTDTHVGEGNQNEPGDLEALPDRPADPPRS